MDSSQGMTGAAKRLLTNLKAPTWWVEQSAGKKIRDLQLWSAFRENDRAYLYGRSPSNSRGIITSENAYVHDPLAQRMGEVWGEMIYGSDPVFTSETKKNQKIVDEIVEENNLPSEFQRAEPICATEGEVWYRILVDPETCDCPMVEWYSRLDVFPVFNGRKLAAVAFVQMLDQRSASEVYRFVELQVKGKSWNLLFKGEKNKLGVEVPLSERDETADVNPTYEVSSAANAGAAASRTTSEAPATPATIERIGFM